MKGKLAGDTLTDRETQKAREFAQAVIAIDRSGHDLRGPFFREVASHLAANGLNYTGRLFTWMADTYEGKK